MLRIHYIIQPQVRKTGVVSICYAIFLLFFTINVFAKSPKTLMVILHIEPPYSDIVDGKFIGENVDIARALAAQMGKEIEFLYCPVARCMSMIKSGQADIIVGVRKTALREESLGFLTSPIKIQALPLRFYLHANNNFSINNYDDLYSLKVGYLRGATYFDKFDFDKKITKVPLTNYHQLVDMLLKNRIDTFIEREESIIPIIKKSFHADNIKLAKFSYDKGVKSYIAVSKNSAFIDELAELSQALEVLLENGEIKKILDKTRTTVN